jgi:OmpA-OmpF porin, OOP family
MPHRLMIATLLLAVAAATALIAAPAVAQEVKVYGAHDAVNPRDVAAILGAPAAPQAKPMKMRGLRLLDAPSPNAPEQVAALPQATAAAPAAAQEPQQDEVAPPRPAEAQPQPAAAPSALSLPVQFAFDSIEISPSARPQIDAVAAGIRLLPPGRVVVIEGHTDAQGGEVYNQALSQARAQAVRKYLVVVHGINAARLRAVGLGKQMPLPGLDPHAAQNRRVQFRGE